jgi:hypothetical protein
MRIYVVREAPQCTFWSALIFSNLVLMTDPLMDVKLESTSALKNHIQHIFSRSGHWLPSFKSPSGISKNVYIFVQGVKELAHTAVRLGLILFSQETGAFLFQTFGGFLPVTILHRFTASLAP